MPAYYIVVCEKYLKKCVRIHITHKISGEKYLDAKEEDLYFRILYYTFIYIQNKYLRSHFFNH